MIDCRSDLAKKAEAIVSPLHYTLTFVDEIGIGSRVLVDLQGTFPGSRFLRKLRKELADTLGFRESEVGFINLFSNAEFKEAE